MRRNYENSMIYHELTLSGVGLCAFLGLGFEIVILLVLRIHIHEVPVLVLGFLWLLSGILASGAVHMAGAFQNYFSDYILEYAKGCFSRRRVAFAHTKNI